MSDQYGVLGMVARNSGKTIHRLKNSSPVYKCISLLSTLKNGIKTDKIFSGILDKSPARKILFLMVINTLSYDSVKFTWLKMEMMNETNEFTYSH